MEKAGQEPPDQVSNIEGLFTKFKAMAEEYWVMIGLAPDPKTGWSISPDDGAPIAAGLREKLTMLVRDVEEAASGLGVHPLWSV